MFVFDVPPSAGQIRAQIVAQIESRADPRVTLTRCEAGRAGDSEVEWIAAQLDGALGRFSLTIVPRPLAARGDAAGYVCGVAPRFDPSGDLDGQRALASELAEALDGRAVAATDAARAEALAEVCAITQPASGAFETFAGYAACWPIRDTDGLVRLALVARGRVLELLVGPRAGRERWPGQAGHLAVAYREDTPLRSPRERAAFAQLVRRLRE